MQFNSQKLQFTYRPIALSYRRGAGYLQWCCASKSLCPATDSNF